MIHNIWLWFYQMTKTSVSLYEYYCIETDLKDQFKDWFSFQKMPCDFCTVLTLLKLYLKYTNTNHVDYLISD